MKKYVLWFGVALMTPNLGAAQAKDCRHLLPDTLFVRLSDDPGIHRHIKFEDGQAPLDEDEMVVGTVISAECRRAIGRELLLGFQLGTEYGVAFYRTPFARRGAAMPGVLVRNPEGQVEGAGWADGRLVPWLYHKRQEVEDRRRAEAERAAARGTARRSEILSHGWPEDMAELVIARQVAIGMTPAMVTASWGEPENVNTTITAAGQREQWVYVSSYVYFEDGVVSAIQTSR